MHSSISREAGGTFISSWAYARPWHPFSAQLLCDMKKDKMTNRRNHVLELHGTNLGAIRGSSRIIPTPTCRLWMWPAVCQKM
mmetsp:Transcript_56548/g.112457  ORF Transcript_56548/g.112457 Transcript_56548/m.112457 type:complete len:82 (-) Transcript_56548:56-301(-)